MPDHKDYQSAMDKVAPSEDWKAATLQKMAAARAQQERPKAAPRLRVAKKVGVPLAAAAAVAMLAVPAALRSGGLSAAGGTAPQTAMLYSAAAQDEAATSEAAMAEENMQDGMQAKGAPAAPRDFDLGEYEGLPELVLGDDSGGMGGGRPLWPKAWTTSGEITPPGTSPPTSCPPPCRCGMPRAAGTPPLSPAC